MQRILICARAYPPDSAGGGEISTGLIARGLRELGLDVSVLTFGRRPIHEQLDGVPVRRLGPPPIYWSLDSDRQPRWRKLAWHVSQSFRRQPFELVRQAIEESSPQLVHTSTIEDFGPGTWRWCEQLGITTVHTLRSYNLLHRGATLYDPNTDRQLSPDWLSIPKKRSSQSLQGVIGISRFILDRHSESGFFANARTTVIANPIQDPIVESQPPAEETRDDPIRLGILGRLSPEKGIAEFLDSMRGLPASPPWSLQIAGDGPDVIKTSLKRKADGLPVEFVGWQKSRDFLMQLDLLIVPSRWHEPFGRIVVEAYSVGLPVLCLQRGGLPELVIDGETGWTTDQWNRDVIVHAMTQCRRLDRSRIIQEAEKYTTERIAKEHLAFYDKILR